MSSLLKILIALVVTLSGQAVAADEARVVLPPASLGKWYKPVNERQVWLHTMFSLRREMQAVGEYLALGEQALAEKWTQRLLDHYSRIGEMVPEWRAEIDLEQAEALRSAVSAGEPERAAQALRKLGLSCRSCHREFRAVTALLYRAPDFGPIAIEDSETLESLPYGEAMEKLSLLVNRVKIASEDGRGTHAAEALAELRRRLDDLGGSCKSCHQDDGARDRILGERTSAALDELASSVAGGDAKSTGRHLGTVAVLACASCHGVHRTLAEMRKTLLP